MGFLDWLGGQKKTQRGRHETKPSPVTSTQPTPQPPTALPDVKPRQSATQFADQLRDAVLRDIPDDWRVFRSEKLLFEIPYPASWTCGLDPKGDPRRINRVIVPAGARTLSESGNLIYSPAFTFKAGGGATLADNRLLDVFDGPDAGMGFQDYTVRESERTTLSGVRILARTFDFTRPSGPWRCLMTARVRGNNFWYFDVSGLPEDVESFRSQLVPVLANLRLYRSVEDFKAAVPAKSQSPEVAPRETVTPPTVPSSKPVLYLFFLRQGSPPSVATM